MNMFEIYKKTVTVKVNGQDQTYELKPLSGRFLPKLYNIIQKLNGKSTEEEILDNLDEQTVQNLHSIIYETLASSYPDMAKDGKKDDLDRFVSQNLPQFIGPIVQVNMGENDQPK